MGPIEALRTATAGGEPPVRGRPVLNDCPVDPLKAGMAAAARLPAYTK